MPPKPWETSAANKERIDTTDIASGTPFTSTNQNATTNLQDNANNMNNPLNNTSDPFGSNNGYNNSYSSSYGGGYGSGYGSYGGGYGSGYGGYGSSFGSSYGGYGGGGYGSYGGYGGGGYGRFGSFNRGPNQQGGNFMEFALRYLDSFSYGVSSLCEMTRNIEMNAEGLSRFWASMRNILARFFSWFASAFKGGREIILAAFNKIKTAMFSKDFVKGLLFSDQSPKGQVINVILRVCMISLALSLAAPLMKIKGK